MQDFINKKIVLGVCGGVSAYKSAYLIRELTSLGAEVRVIMTQAAQEFISLLLLQSLSGHEVRTHLFDPQAEKAMGHIELARWADYLLIAPATANLIAKMANGLSDDLLSTTYLVAQVPVIVCPAMNQAMWSHPATQANYKLLSERGVVFVGPELGMQACGEFGVGRFSEGQHIINALRLYEIQGCLRGEKVVITAGATRERIDPVRYLSNDSSGKMGYALAEAAKLAGANVTLISGPSTLTAPAFVEFIQVESAQSMYEAAMAHCAGSIFISVAAVADFQVQSPALKKITKKDQQELTVHLIPTPDIVRAVAHSNQAEFVVGFAAQTHDVLSYAQAKLQDKKLDMIIANQVGPHQGFESDYNEVTVITKTNSTLLALNHKIRIAGQIIAIIAENLYNRSKKSHRKSHAAPSTNQNSKEPLGGT